MVPRLVCAAVPAISLTDCGMRTLATGQGMIDRRGGSMVEIGRKQLLLLLIGLDSDARPEGSLSGLTRLQKFLFLLEREAGITPTAGGFEFQPYKAGPYSPKLYDDLELLENLGLIRGEATAESTATERADIDRLSFDDLIGGPDEVDGTARTADAFQERRYVLTEKGRERVEGLLADPANRPVVDGIRKVKTKYTAYSLKDLLRYVYTKYPEMTTMSEILEEVLGRRRA